MQIEDTMKFYLILKKYLIWKAHREFCCNFQKYWLTVRESYGMQLNALKKEQLKISVEGKLGRLENQIVDGSKKTVPSDTIGTCTYDLTETGSVRRPANAQNRQNRSPEKGEWMQSPTPYLKAIYN